MIIEGYSLNLRLKRYNLDYITIFYRTFALAY